MLYGTIILPDAGISQIVRPACIPAQASVTLMKAGLLEPQMIIYHLIALFLPCAAFDMQFFIFLVSTDPQKKSHD
jgi:hypothetical protein